MKNIELASGDQMPVLGLGTWKMSDGTAYSAVKTAIENGYRHIDCAWIYENEADVGRALKECLDAGIVKREELWVTSKLWNDRHRAEHVQAALKESLNNLQLDYLDLYLIHWPVAQQFGVARPESGDQFESLQNVPLVETWNAMQQCTAAGLCRNVGVSNFSQKKIAHLIEATGKAPAANQVESHPFLQQKGLFDYCQENKIAFTAYSPLGSGDRPDGMKQENEPSLFDNEVLKEIGQQHELSAAQVMLAWAVNRGTIPIPKSANAQRQQENLAAASTNLSGEQMQAIAQVDKQHRFVDGTFWEVEGGPYTVAELWDE